MSVKYNKEELEKLIIIDKLSYINISKIFGVSDTYIKKIARKLGIILPNRKIIKNNYMPHNKGTGKKIICQNCEEIIPLSHHSLQKFCNKKCEGLYKTKMNYKKYLVNQDEYCGVRNMKFIKKHILFEQSNKCSICNNIDVWDNKHLVFILDHIDGNAANNLRINLRLICPNCDSQLSTFKSKNKNSARKERYILNKK